MERRLPLALFLSFLVLFGWTLLFPPTEEPRAATGDPARPAAPAPAAVPGAVSADEPGLQPEIAADGLVEDTLLLGEPGAPGYFEAGF